MTYALAQQIWGLDRNFVNASAKKRRCFGATSLIARSSHALFFRAIGVSMLG